MTYNRSQLEELYQLQLELATRKARSNFKAFISLIKPDYDFQWFNEFIADKLDAFKRGEIKNMMILMPPQHGKSELASRLYPPKLLGYNPDVKIGLITYNDTFAKKFNRQIQRYIDNETYASIFPETRLQGSGKDPNTNTNYARNANEFEIVGHRGGMITVGREGQINGLPIDTLIIDDLYKNREEAISPTVSEKIWGDYNEVFKTRLHNDSQQLIMNTRWDELDVAGRLLKYEPEQWVVIKFPAIRENELSEFDPRKEGEALYPSKHSLERLLDAKKRNPITFNSLYQQDPKPNSELLCIPTWHEVEEFPSDVPVIKYGIDWGWITDPTSVVKLGVDLERMHLYIDELFYMPLGSAAMDSMDNTPTREEMLKRIKESSYVEGMSVTADIKKADIAFLTQNGIYCAPSLKPEGSVQQGIALIRKFKIFVTKRSINVKKCFNNYQWVTYGDIVTKTPLENGYDHAPDSIRYGLYNYYYGIC